MRKGVTLIELMVVIIVLGILATLALPNIKNIAKQARESAQATDIATVQSAVDTFRLNSATNADPSIGSVAPATGKVALIDFDLLKTEYLRGIPNSADVNYDGVADTNKVVYVIDENGTVEVMADSAAVAAEKTTPSGALAYVALP